MRKKISFFTLIISFFLLSNSHQLDEWNNYYQSDEFIISSKSFQCIDEINGTDHNYILFRFENKTDEEITISYKQELWYDNQCANCESSSAEHIKTITLRPKEIIEGDCTSKSNLKIFQNMPSGLTKRALTKFELKDIHSTSQK